MASFWQARTKLLKTGQVTDYTPASRTALDDGGQLAGLAHLDLVPLTTGQYSGTTNITVNAKTETKSNNVVVDKSTGLMWGRTPSASVGPASLGTLYWSDAVNGEDVFNYCDQANIAGYAGHSDWRVPNLMELLSICLQETGFDSTAFPAITGSNYYSSTTFSATPTLAYVVFGTNGNTATSAKTTGARYAVLVRG